MKGFPNPEKAHYSQGYDPERASGEAIKNGLAIRLLIPYPDAVILDARIDGHPVRESAVHGYQMKHFPGTIVQFNIPPDKVGDLHIMTCLYKTDIMRKAGFKKNDW